MKIDYKKRWQRICHRFVESRAGPNTIFQASNTRWFFRANIRILVPEKTPSKTTLIIPIYSLEPILTVSAYFVEDLIAFERQLVGLSKLELLSLSPWKRTAVVPYKISCPLPSQPLGELFNSFWNVHLFREFVQ